VTRDEAAHLVIATMRERVFGGADHEVGLDDTFAELGVDSLAIVILVSGLESAVGKMFPVEFWEARSTFAVVDLVDEVERLSRERSGTFVAAPVVDVSEAAQSRLGSTWPMMSVRPLVGATVRRAFSRLDAILVERELIDLPDPDPPRDVVLRRATAADEQALAGLWEPGRQRIKTAQFRARLAAGSTCVAAFHDEVILALDWLNERDPPGHVVARPGTCLGVDMHRRSGEERRDIGRALLAYSLQVAHENGYQRKVAYVEVHNARMLAAAIGVLGYASFGTAHRTMVLGRARWSWTVHGVEGSGPTLVL
jgi:acyl carrier protein